MTTFLTLWIAASFLTATLTCRLFAVGARDEWRASTLAGNTYTAASMNIVANTDGKKTEVNQNQLIELRAELNRVKADLRDELDKVNADAEKLRAFNVSHR